MPPKHDAGTATRHYRAFWQRRCRAAAAGAVLKPQGGNCAVLPYNFITVALHASAFVTVFNILLWTVGYGMISGSHSFVMLLFAAALALANLMKSFYPTINEYAIHSASGKR
ncbi:MAG: hypothetical protein ACLSUC_00570 [Subdoligranulum sp.]